MPTTSLDTLQAGAQITRDDYSWNPTLGTALTITWAFRADAGAGGIQGGGSGFAQFNAAQIVAAERSMQAWADVANIDLTRVGSGTSGSGAYSDNATILLGDYTSGASGAAAYTFLPINGDRSIGSYEGDVWVNSSLPYNAYPTYKAQGGTYAGLIVGGYGAQALTHEIGHAFGLEHPGDYNANPNGQPTYQTDAEYIQDTRQYSVMSYFSETYTGANFNGFYSAAPLMDDIAAMQRLYGANTTAFSGDTTYGFNSNTSRDYFTATSQSSIMIFCIWDTGGHDTLDFSGFSDNQKIDLGSGPDHFSNVAGMTGNVSIYDGVVIEDAKGGAGDDLMLGNEVGNHLWGNAGIDTLQGGAGDDTLEGGAGADVLQGGEGNDTYVYDFTDTITDTGGIDTVEIDTNVTAVTGPVSLATLGLTGIENLAAVGTADIDLAGDDGANVVSGDEGRNLLQGGAGDDTLAGNGGDDTLDGGAGHDSVDGGAGTDELLVDFSTATAAIRSDYAANSFRDASGDMAVDYVNIENFFIRTGSGDDQIVTGDGADSVLAGAGDDVIDTGHGTAVVDGGEGVDLWIADVSDMDSKSRLDLGKASQGFHGGTILGIEHIDLTLGQASDKIITLVGAEADYGDTVLAGGGNDKITVGGGLDSVAGGEGKDTLIIDYAWTSDAVVSEAGGGDIRDALDGFGVVFSGMESLDVLTGSGDDMIITGAGRDTVQAGAGDDIIDTGQGAAVVNGGEGVDLWRADLSAATARGKLDLGHVSHYLGGTIQGVEHIDLTAGSGDDTIVTLVGPDADFGDTIHAGAGDDVVTVGGGLDSVDGGDGKDTLVIDDQWTSEALVSSAGGLTGVNGDVGVGFANIEQLDILAGAGDDTLVGGPGNDTLDGGLGTDQLTGGGGKDVFVFASTAESSVDSPDTITDLATGDTIDLSGIDANVDKAGNQAFAIVDHFTGKAGQLVIDYSADQDRTTVSGDTNGDGQADFSIWITGDHADFTGFAL